MGVWSSLKQAFNEGLYFPWRSLPLFYQIFGPFYLSNLYLIIILYLLMVQLFNTCQVSFFLVKRWSSFFFLHWFAITLWDFHRFSSQQFFSGLQLFRPTVLSDCARFFPSTSLALYSILARSSFNFFHFSCFGSTTRYLFCCRICDQSLGFPSVRFQAKADCSDPQFFPRSTECTYVRFSIR